MFSLTLTRIKIGLQFISFIIDLHDESFAKWLNAPIIIPSKISNLLSSDTFNLSRSIRNNNSINRLTAFCSHKYGIIVDDNAKFFINPTVALIIPKYSLKFLSRNSLMIFPIPYDLRIVSRASFSRSWRAVTCRSVHN